MRTTKNASGIQPTRLHYIVGMFALALVGCSSLCIYWYMAPAHASSGAQQANVQTMSGQVAFAETETETSSPTITTTPSPTVTTTSTPSPSATRTITPSPTSARSATPLETVRPSPAAAGTQTPSPAATPTSSATSISITTQGTGANQTPVVSSAQTNNLGDQASQRTHLTGNTFPFSSLMIGLGSLALLGLLLILGWMIVRRGLLPVSSPKLPPSGATPWSRVRISDQEELQTKQGYATYYAPSARTTTAIPGLYTSSAVSRPGSLFIPGSNPPEDVDRSGVSTDWSYLAARIRQRRNELRATDNMLAFQKQAPGELPTEITELSDPYLQSLIQLYSARRRM